MIVRIKKYSPSKLTPPYEFETLSEVEYTEQELQEAHPEENRQHYTLFRSIASSRGYLMKFWSMDSEDNSKVIVIEDETSEKLYRLEHGLPVDE